MPRYAAKTDGNQAEIVNDLRAMGFSVESLASVGNGMPDIAVGWDRLNWFFELKDPSRPKSSQKLNPLQVEFHNSWRGQVAVVKDTWQLLRAIVASGYPSFQLPIAAQGLLLLGPPEEETSSSRTSSKRHQKSSGH